MNTVTWGLLAVLVVLIALAGYVGTQFPRVSEPVIVPAPTPVDWGYAVGPGYQTQPVVAQAARPTSEWLQPGLDISCDMADAIARDAASHTCEALLAKERDDPHVQRGLQIEPGNQVTRIHEFGRYNYMLFAQALIVWRNEGDDGRIAVLSPHGCWRALPEPPGTPAR